MNLEPYIYHIRLIGEYTIHSGIVVVVVANTSQIDEVIVVLSMLRINLQ